MNFHNRLNVKQARSNTKKYSLGHKYRDFIITKTVELEELQCDLIELTHIPTGAKVVHIANEDPENLFCLSFKTLPDSSNGVAHILEHTVLCGSKKFPVKDPFFAMRRRSLHTFMNAMTGPDFTCYPAASQVPQDFYNLLDVYLDAVFQPVLSKVSFLQEGHRLEFADPTDPESPLEHKGIVFNEMKGVMTAPLARLDEAMNQALFPDLSYGYNSGGDPKVIPLLTYDDLRSFHQKYYHPSRCLFFFYGNMPLEGHLDFITEQTLNKFSKIDPLPFDPVQKRFSKARHLAAAYPIAADESINDKTYIAFGWLTCPIIDQQDMLALTILEIVLMDTDASPLKIALLKSGLCKQASAHLEEDISEAPLVIVLTGCNPESAGDLEKILRSTLQEIVKQGIAPELIENAMHQLEIYRSEITGGSEPFGLSLFMRAGLLIQHHADPESGLVIHTLFNQIRQRQEEDSAYWTKLIQKYLLDNTHFVQLVMSPSKELAAQETVNEFTILENIRKDLTDQQKKQVLDRAKELADYQQAQEETDINVLPKISIKDIPADSRDFPISKEELGKLTVFHHHCFTNDIVYVDLMFDLPEIREEDLPILRFFTLLISQIGCGGRDYIETLNYLQANTGGVAASLMLSHQADDFNQFKPAMRIRGKALHRNIEKLFLFLRDLTTSMDFSDKSRLKEILMKHYTMLQGSLNQSALRYAINLSASSLDLGSKISNFWYGLDYFYRIRQLVENFDEEFPVLVTKLQALQKSLFHTEKPDLVLTCDQDTFKELKQKQFFGLNTIESYSQSHWKGDYKLNPVRHQGRIIASPVAFTGKVFKTLSYVHPETPALSLAACLFDNLILHPSIREQGGAYGGGAICNAMSGNFYFYSHRDPNIASTIEAFDAAIQQIILGNFDDDDLEEAKLEVIQSLDAPVAPGNRGELAYSWWREGKTLEMRRDFRKRLLAATREDVIKAVATHLVEQNKMGVVVTFAGKSLLEKENLRLAASHREILHLEPI